MAIKDFHGSLENCIGMGNNIRSIGGSYVKHPDVKAVIVVPVERHGISDSGLAKIIGLNGRTSPATFQDERVIEIPEAITHIKVLKDTENESRYRVKLIEDPYNSYRQLIVRNRYSLR